MSWKPYVPKSSDIGFSIVFAKKEWYDGDKFVAKEEVSEATKCIMDVDSLGDLGSVEFDASVRSRKFESSISQDEFVTTREKVLNVVRNWSRSINAVSNFVSNHVFGLGTKTIVKGSSDLVDDTLGDFSSSWPTSVASTSVSLADSLKVESDDQFVERSADGTMKIVKKGRTDIKTTNKITSTL